MSGPHNGTETECRKKRKSSGNHEISEFDKKRSFSSKEKHEQSLRVITKLKTNKIHVNDDVTEPVPLKDQRICSNKQSEWFDIEKNKNMGKDKDKDDGHNNIGNDNEGDEPMLPILEIAEKSQKLSMLQTKVGNDKSFILDGGFLDENEAQTKKIKHEDEHEDESEKMETEEKAWQMDTSGNVSKKPVKSKTWRKKPEMVEIQKKGKIMRCDSSQEERIEFELPPQGCQLRRLDKSKRKEKMTKVEEGKSLRDLKDAFYKLPSNLMKTSSKELEDIDIEVRESSKRNSRGEVKDRVENIEKVPCADDEGDHFVSRSKDFKLHFYHSTKEDFRQRDKCLQGQDSHKKLETTGEEGSPKLLKELKQLVRSKIRNNVKKKSSWSRKKKGRKSSQRHLSNLLLHTQDRDLKAFERRLTEVIASLQPSTLRWRILFAVLLGSISVCTAIGAWHWLTDPNTSAVSFTQSLYNHPFFTLSSTILVILFMMGVHRRVIAPSIITQRARSVLGDFNMSCDDTGKLILKPTRPPHPHET